MIAAGIFVLSGLAVSNVGTVAIVSFLIAAVIASFTAAAYGEFSSIYPESGGGYMYVANTFSETDLTYIMGLDDDPRLSRQRRLLSRQFLRLVLSIHVPGVRHPTVGSLLASRASPCLGY